MSGYEWLVKLGFLPTVGSGGACDGMEAIHETGAE